MAWKKVAAQSIIVIGYWGTSLTWHSLCIHFGHFILTDVMGFSHLTCPASEHFLVWAEAQEGAGIFCLHRLIGKDLTKM